MGSQSTATASTHKIAASRALKKTDTETSMLVSRALIKKRAITTLSKFKEAYSATEVERVLMIRQGVPATLLVEMGRTMDISNDLLWTTLALPRSTVVRKIQKNEFLTAEQSERVIGLERLVGQVAEMVSQSGNSEGFDAGRWVGEWLQRPLSALAGKKPAEYMDTMAGQGLVSKLLAQSQSGAYA
ncbi:MAG: antitoxin Xre/MbcA/ParS toxin-binding domain-containing protein [Gallionellaceae bacterium]